MRRVLTNPIREVLEPLVEAAQKSPAGDKPDLPDREFLEAVLYRARTGLPWRDLPEEFGGWNAVYRRAKRWRLAGNWDRPFDALPAGGPAAEAKRLFVDSTVVRAHQHAAGANKKSPPTTRPSAGPEAGSRRRST